MIVLCLAYIYMGIYYFTSYCCKSCCINTKCICFKGFEVITVAAARGLFGTTAIRWKNDKDPPCLKIHGKLYKANPTISIFLLYYILAVIVILVLVSLEFSTHVSYGLEACNEKNVDCFYVNVTDGVLDVTDITNCSLLFEDASEDDIQCFVGLQPTVALALLGGYISFIPPLMFSFTNVVHTKFIYEECLKKRMPSDEKKFGIGFIIATLTSIAASVYTLLIMLKDHEKEYNNAIIKFILKDTITGQVIAVIITFIAFLSFPWFVLGKYRDDLKQGFYEQLETQV